TNEVAGVLPIPADIRSKSGMAQFEASLHSEQRHRYLAALQGTRKPVLPVHSAPEKTLFRNLVAEHPAAFSTPTTLDNFVRLWNSHADQREDISYKLSEQLKVYYNGDWKTNTNIIHSKVMSADKRTALNSRLQNPARALAAPVVPETQLKLHSAPSGMLPLFDEPLISFNGSSVLPQAISYSGLSSGTSAPSIIASTYFIAGPSSSAAFASEQGSSRALMPAPPSQATVLQQLARKHVADGMPIPALSKKRKTRTCRKCGIPSCKGRRGWKDCVNKCQDCGKSGSDLSCKGRNPDKPLGKCMDVEW
ncbi:hypothetical protein B0H16DRAFT_1337422, partial [Mycena metata]